MTNDELLAKLYDGTLTAAEQDILQQRIQESPEFAGEVEEFETVVELMETSSEDDEPKPALLRTTKEKVIALIGAAAGTATIGGAASQMGGGLFTSVLFKWIAGVVGALTFGGLVLWTVNDSSNDGEIAQNDQVQVDQGAEAPDQSEIDGPETSGPGTDATQFEEPSLTNDANSNPDNTVNPAQSDVDIAGANSSLPAETAINHPNDVDLDNNHAAENDAVMSASKDPLHDMLLQAIPRERKSLELMKALDSATGQAYHMTRLAGWLARLQEYDEGYVQADRAVAIYRKYNSDTDLARALYVRAAASVGLDKLTSAEQDLDEAERLARGSNLPELRGKIAGQRGLLALARGDLQSALQGVTTCVQVLESSRSEELRSWQNWQNVIRQRIEGQ